MSDGEERLAPRPHHHGAQDIDAFDTDSDDEFAEGAEPFGGIFRMALNPRVVGWQLNRHRAPLDSNAALVDHLAMIDVISQPEVKEAMKICARDQFIPGGAREHPDIFADAPIHVSGFGFNISAPHMHATCLEALDLKPGHQVLDIGSGSGLLTAYIAVMVGKTGGVLGIDCMREATLVARRNVRRLQRRSPEFVEKAAPCAFHTHNAFLPAGNFKGRFDRIVAGASCPPDRIDWLLSLLKPQGGVLVTPVIPSDLRKYTKLRSGDHTSRTLSQVRFSNLELPKEVSVIKALLEQDRQASTTAPTPESTFAVDVASITGGTSPLASSSLSSEQTPFHGSYPGSNPSPSSWPRRVSKLFTACSAGSGSGGEDASMDGSETPRSPTLLPPILDVGCLGPTDCTFLGSGWSLPAHKAVLRNRADLFRAQCASGMRDAEASEVHVPETFAKAAVDAFLKYCYTDKLETCDTAEATASCLAVAVYFGAPHLVQLCELALAEELSDADDGTVNLAPHLLALADETSLPHLKAVAVDFICAHYESVAETAAFASLTKQQVDLVAAHACARLQHFHKLLEKMEGEQPTKFTAFP